MKNNKNYQSPGLLGNFVIRLVQAFVIWGMMMLNACDSGAQVPGKVEQKKLLGDSLADVKICSHVSYPLKKDEKLTKTILEPIPDTATFYLCDKATGEILRVHIKDDWRQSILYKENGTRITAPPRLIPHAFHGGKLIFCDQKRTQMLSDTLYEFRLKEDKLEQTIREATGGGFYCEYSETGLIYCTDGPDGDNLSLKIREKDGTWHQFEHDYEIVGFRMAKVASGDEVLYTVGNINGWAKPDSVVFNIFEFKVGKLNNQTELKFFGQSGDIEYLENGKLYYRASIARESKLYLADIRTKRNISLKVKKGFSDLFDGNIVLVGPNNNLWIGDFDEMLKGNEVCYSMIQRSKGGLLAIDKTYGLAYMINNGNFYSTNIMQSNKDKSIALMPEYRVIGHFKVGSKIIFYTKNNKYTYEK